MDAMSHALRRAVRSSFSDEIGRAPMPSRFRQPPFNSYDGKTNPVEHVNHYIHMMSLHTHNDGQADPRIRCSDHKMQLSAATSGCITLYEDEGRRNPS